MYFLLLYNLESNLRIKVDERDFSAKFLKKNRKGAVNNDSALYLICFSSRDNLVVVVKTFSLFPKTVLIRAELVFKRHAGKPESVRSFLGRCCLREEKRRLLLLFSLLMISDVCLRKRNFSIGHSTKQVFLSVNLIRFRKYYC